MKPTTHYVEYGIKTAHGVARYARIVKLSQFGPMRGRYGRKLQTAYLECGHLHESDAADRRRGEVYCGGCYDGRKQDFDPASMPTQLVTDP